MTVYLLHFITPAGSHMKIGSAGHYLGSTTPDSRLETRMKEHRAAGGRGGRMVRTVMKRGGDFIVARTWEGQGKSLENKIRKQGRHPKYCPICSYTKGEMPIEFDTISIPDTILPATAATSVVRPLVGIT